MGDHWTPAGKKKDPIEPTSYLHMSMFKGRLHKKKCLRVGDISESLLPNISRYWGRGVTRDPLVRKKIEPTPYSGQSA